MDSEKTSKWGHNSSYQAGVIDDLLLSGLSEDQIIKAFAKEYPRQINSRTRVKRHLKHLSDDHHVDLSFYFDK